MNQIKTKLSLIILAASLLLLFVPAKIVSAAQCNNGETIPDSATNLSEEDRTAANEAFCNDGRRGIAAITGSGSTDCGNRTLLGLPAWDKYLEHESVDGRCSPVINSSADALPIGVAVLEVMLRLGGLVAVAMVFVGAFKYISSQGNPEGATSARKTIINAMIGLTIIILSTAIVGFVGSRFV